MHVVFSHRSEGFPVCLHCSLNLFLGMDDQSRNVWSGLYNGLRCDLRCECVGGDLRCTAGGLRAGRYIGHLSSFG